MARLSDIISTPDLAGYVRDSEAITWIEPQTFAKPIENVDTGIKHNVASFQLVNGMSEGQIPGAPSGWILTHNPVTDPGVYTITHSLGYTVYPIATAKNEDRMAYPSMNDGTQFILRTRHIGVGASGSTLNVQVAY